MGNCESGNSKLVTNKRVSNVNLYRLMKGGSYFNEQNTINFSRKDLADTLSDSSIINIMHGGGEKLKHYPKRDRYSKYETQQIKNHNQNLWGGHQISTVSEQEMQTLRNLITQNGGCGCSNPQLHQSGGCGCGSQQIQQNGGCGCGENSVLKGGFVNIQNNTATSSFMPNTASDLSATSHNSTGGFVNELNNTATSSFMPNTAADLSATSVSSVQRGGLSATSTLNNSALNTESSQNGGVASSTSEFGRSEQQLYYNPELQQYQTNVYNGNNVNNENNVVNQVNSINSDSAMDRLTNLMGNNIQMGQMGGARTFSATSSQPIKYEDLVGSGWGKKSKKQKGGAKDKDSSSSSSVTSPTSSSNSSTTVSDKDDKNEVHARLGRTKQARTKQARTESPTEILESVKTSPSSSSTVSSSTTEESKISRDKPAGKSQRSSRASSSSSDGTTPSSHSYGGSSSSSSSGSTFSSSSSTTSRSPNSKTVKRNIYLSTTASEGNVIDAKQFYSSDQGELYSSDTNYIRHNLTKRRFR